MPFSQASPVYEMVGFANLGPVRLKVCFYENKHVR